MYFDFDEHRPEYEPVGRAISLREGVLLSIIAHLVLVIFVLLTWSRWFGPREAERQALLAANARPQEPLTFVYVPDHVPAPKPPPRGEASDIDRVARARERAQTPTNELPFSRGNTPERVDAPPQEAARGRGPQPEPQAGPIAPVQPVEAPPPPPEPPPQKLAETPSGLVLPPQRPPAPQAGAFGRSALPGGAMGKALSNLQRIIQSDTFRNLQGGVGQKGDAIQFDTKGVEFGPWIRRFVERVRSNWNVPYAAMSLKGHVVITFNIHKNGTITDLSIVGPCPIESFNAAAFGALVASNPTDPLPPEYPDEKAFFTVTFFYNEEPQ
jgi:TonB family protein